MLAVLIASRSTPLLPLPRPRHPTARRERAHERGRHGPLAVRIARSGDVGRERGLHRRGGWGRRRLQALRAPLRYDHTPRGSLLQFAWCARHPTSLTLLLVTGFCLLLGSKRLFGLDWWLLMQNFQVRASFEEYLMLVCGDWVPRWCPLPGFSVCSESRPIWSTSIRFFSVRSFPHPVPIRFVVWVMLSNISIWIGVSNFLSITLRSVAITHWLHTYNPISKPSFTCANCTDEIASDTSSIFLLLEWTRYCSESENGALLLYLQSKSGDPSYHIIPYSFDCVPLSNLKATF